MKSLLSWSGECQMFYQCKRSAVKKKYLTLSWLLLLSTNWNCIWLGITPLIFHFYNIIKLIEHKGGQAPWVLLGSAFDVVFDSYYILMFYLCMNIVCILLLSCDPIVFVTLNKICCNLYRIFTPKWSDHNLPTKWMSYLLCF